MDTAKALLAELEPLENGAPQPLREIVDMLRLAVNETEAVGDGNPSWQINPNGEPIPGKNRTDHGEGSTEGAAVGGSPV